MKTKNTERGFEDSKKKSTSNLSYVESMISEIFDEIRRENSKS